MRRVGLDYWKDLEMEVYESYEVFMEKYGNKRIFLLIIYEGIYYDEIFFEEGDFIMFGREFCGVFEEVYKRFNGFRVFMIKFSVRSLNLFNIVVIVVYEVLR